MAEVLCLGEILVDWVCTAIGEELDGARTFTKAPGGAPANVAVGLARQGVKTAFVGRVSTDAFGRWLKGILEDEGIDISCTVDDPEAQTRMAYVVTTKTGDRKLAEFSRISVADSRLCRADLKEALFADAKALHFGSISLISEPSAGTTFAAIELAKKNGLIVSYDPNVRIGLWPSPDICRNTILDTLALADVVKINLDELEFLTGSRGFEAAERLRKEKGLPLLLITLDANGAFFATAAGNRTVSGFQIQLVEATGAGDGFVAGVLEGLLKEIGQSDNRQDALTRLSLDQLAQIIRQANAIGALTCTRAGAIPALPRKEEVKIFLQSMSAQASS